MATFATHNDLETTGAGHDRSRDHRHFANRNAGPIVQTEYGVHRELAEQPILDHDQRPTFRFLGRLEDEMDRPVQAKSFGVSTQIARRTQ